MRWLIFLCAALTAYNVRAQQLDWPLNSAVTDLTVGPTDAVHCRVSTPRGATVFDGFGQCKVIIDHVTAEHDGTWTLEVTQPSSVVAVTQEFTVRVTSAASGMSSPIVEYVGAGLDAGECGARFTGLLRSDSGAWSCHVGLPDNAVEQRAQITVTVQGPIAGNQYLDGQDLVVEGLVFARPSLEYCRFVRIDGLGFTSENVPEGYVDSSSISQGVCRIRVASPTILDHHPWTVVAKTSNSDEEFSDSTIHTLTMPMEFDEPPPSRWWIYVLLAAVVVGLAVLSLKRHRRWAAALASSFSNKLRKPVVDETPEKTGPPV